MNLSALLLVKNEEEMIKACLVQLKFADEIVVLDQNSTDKTCEIAGKYTKKIYRTNEKSFANNRNYLLNLAKSKWVLYLDADERLPPETRQMILSQIKKTNGDTAYYFPRKNFILGKWLRHGGWWPDYTPRLFLKEKLTGWQGDVHESPIIMGQKIFLETPIIHLSARSISQMFSKSIKWAEIEANLFALHGYPTVNIAQVIKAMVREFVKRYIFKLGILDGPVGLIEGIYQAVHQAMILTYLWEMQNNKNKNTPHFSK